MSINGYAIIGLRVLGSNVAEMKKAKVFEHDYPSDWTVDPKTGNHLWYPRLTPIPPFTEVNGEFYISGYLVFPTVDTYGDKVPGHFIVCACPAAESDTYTHPSQIVPVRLPDDSALNGFKREMVKLKLWDEKEFGLWSLTRVS